MTTRTLNNLIRHRDTPNKGAKHRRHHLKNKAARRTRLHFPGIPDASIDFLFSFGVFVHIDFPVIEIYLDKMKRVMKPGANVVLHYGDKHKVMAAENDGFAHNTPEMMRAAILARGYTILEEDTTLLSHSAMVRFTTTMS